jgi:hypothetical protein
MAQITKIEVGEQYGLSPENIQWMSVDQTAGKVKMKAVEDQGGEWDDIKKLMGGLPLTKGGRGKGSGWWNEEINRMERDVRSMGRREGKDGDDGWRLARRVFRNTLINWRYYHLKDRLATARENDIFKMVKYLKGRRAIPYLYDRDR